MQVKKNMTDSLLPENISKKLFSATKAVHVQTNTALNYITSFSRYLNDFTTPFLLSTNYFTNAEARKLTGSSPLETYQSYMGLMSFVTDLSSRGLHSTMKSLNEYIGSESGNLTDALLNTFLAKDENQEDIIGFINRQANTINMVTHEYPRAIDAIAPEYGFGFERGENIKAAETDRFILYQILPTDKKVTVREDGKPVLIIPPYVLGANILGFLPGENRSYTHCFANQGIPTYIRVMKDIAVTPAVQVVTGEEDALDTKFFCEKIMARHGKAVTLNGYCQGGFVGVCNVLSGELDGVVDALITCVSPMDGTRSAGFKEFFGPLPQRFNELIYGTKTLANGNKVGDGNLMGWVYKLKSIESEFPVIAFFRDLKMLAPINGKAPKINKSAAAINYWLKNERCDLPLSVTQMSFDSFNTPVTEDGTLPIQLFGRKLNFKRIAEKNIPWLICYGEKDDLVEKDTALAPLDYIDVEVSPFPKGHVAIATSWSNPSSACALHTCFGEKKYRGPVRFQLDLDSEVSPA